MDTTDFSTPVFGGEVIGATKGTNFEKKKKGNTPSQVNLNFKLHPFLNQITVFTLEFENALQRITKTLEHKHTERDQTVLNPFR